MSNNKSTEATRFAKENGFKSAQEMMELLAINTAMTLLDELGAEWIAEDYGWQHPEFTIPALKRIADMPPQELRKNKQNLNNVVKRAVIAAYQAA